MRVVAISGNFVYGKLMKLTVIIPAYQSGKTIEKLLRRLQKVMIKGITKEVIVVDDASTDDTAKKAKSFRWVRLIRHAANTGKGGAVRTGIAKATGDIVYIQDDDLEYDPMDIPKVIAPILTNKFQVSFGSRHLTRTNTYSSLPYFLGGKFVDLVINAVTGAGVSDPLTGSKAFTRAALLKILPLVASGFEIEAEITAKVARAGLSIADVPISYRARTHKQGKNIRWYHALSIVMMLWRLWWKDAADTN